MPHLPGLLALPVLPLLAAPATAAMQVPTDFVNEVIVGNLDQPTSMAFLPGGRLLFIEQRSGKIRMVVNGHIAAKDPVHVITDANTVDNERGLEGIAVDPLWPSSPYVYLDYTRQGDRIRVVRYTATGDVANPLGENLSLTSPLVLIDDIPDVAGNHNGGCVRFGPDHHLYVSLGDDAAFCAAADSTTLRGQILRLRIDGLPAGPGTVTRSAITPQYSPLATPDSNAKLVWAYGLRNPWRFHVDAPTGLLYIADVGDTRYEELTEVWAGDFLGWPWREANLIRTRPECPEPGGPGATRYRPPILELGRGGASTAMLSAGVYRMRADQSANWSPAYHGDAFYAEYYAGWLRRLKNASGTWGPAPLVPGQPNSLDWAQGFVSVADFVQGPDGSLWWLRQFDDNFSSVSGSLGRIRYVGAPIASVEDAIAGATPLTAAPTPFTSRTDLRFVMPAIGYARLELFDLSGRLVRRLLDGTVPAGPHAFTWDGRDRDGVAVAPGVYLARLERPGRVEAARMLRVR